MPLNHHLIWLINFLMWLEIEWFLLSSIPHYLQFKLITLQTYLMCRDISRKKLIIPLLCNFFSCYFSCAPLLLAAWLCSCPGVGLAHSLSSLLMRHCNTAASACCQYGDFGFVLESYIIWKGWVLVKSAINNLLVLVQSPPGSSAIMETS